MKVGIIPYRVENGKKKVLITRYLDIAGAETGEISDPYWAAVLAASNEFNFYYRKDHELNVIFDDIVYKSDRVYAVKVNENDVSHRCFWLDVEEAKAKVPESEKFLFERISRI